VPVTIDVKSDDAVLKGHREVVAQRVLDHLGPCLPNSRVLCFLDDEDPPELRREHGPANRGGYMAVHDEGYLDEWPSYVRECACPSDRFGYRTRVIDDLVYLYGSTCVDEVGLTMTLAHELQHVIQHGKERKLWAVNSLIANDLSRRTIAALKLNWSDIPIEVEARIVSRHVAESIFGEERVTCHIDSKIAERVTGVDVADWQFIRTLTVSSTIDLAVETQQLLKRLKGFRLELENALQEKRQNLDYADIDLDVFFR
jgi:hypothetical protein